jgi:ArsR family transcriptional regulator
MDIELALHPLASQRRLQILDWLREPRKHFREQVDGDLIEDAACGQVVAEKLKMNAPTAGEHMRVLTAARLVCAKRAAIPAITRVIFEKV